LIVTFIIFGIGNKIAVKPKETKGKLAPYACGEDLPAVEAPMNISLYNYAAMFLVLDVVSIMIAFSMKFPFQQQIMIGWLAITYIVLVLISVLLVFQRR
jgi:NADH:ubiquinone oxidoreductase subunit 3 (subunit A)